GGAAAAHAAAAGPGGAKGARAVRPRLGGVGNSAAPPRSGCSAPRPVPARAGTRCDPGAAAPRRPLRAGPVAGRGRPVGGGSPVARSGDPATALFASVLVPPGPRGPPAGALERGGPSGGALQPAGQHV